MRHHPNQIVATTRSWSLIRFGAIFGTLGLYLFLASDALAQGGAERVGRNLGNLLSTVGGYVLFGVAGLVALGMLAARKFTAVGALLCMVFVVGGLFFAGDELAEIVRDTWRSLARGA